jgi:hypothetical protein
MQNENWKCFLFRIIVGIAISILLLPVETKAEGFDSIRVIEYYFDQDPGIGNGVVLTSDSAPAYVANEVIDISALAEGIHTIYFRAQDSTGVWGVQYGKSFYVYTTLETDSVHVPVANLEYSFDNTSNFSSLGAITQDTSVTITTNIDVASRSDPGIHTIYLRAKDTHPHISSMVSKSFYVYRTLETDSVHVPVANLEYSIDNASGFSSLGAIAQDTSVTITPNIDVAGLSDPGIHTIYVRAKDTHPHISSMVSKSFYVYRTLETDSVHVPVANLEYSIDNTSDFSSLGAITQDTSVSITTNIDVAGLSDPGIHTIYVRAKDTHPHISSMVSKSFFVYQKTKADSTFVPVTDIQYSFDNINDFKSLGIIDPDTAVSISADLIDNLISHGHHTILFRAKDANNYFSNIVSDTLYYENEIPVANAGLNRYAGNNTLVTLDGSASFDRNKDALAYHWIAPDGIALSSGTASNPTFTAPAFIDTTYTFILFVNDGLVDSPNDTVTIAVIENNKAVSYTTISGSITACFDGYNTITIAGGGVPVVFESGTSIELIAGHSIRFLPGFRGKSGSFILAYISIDGNFCDGVIEKSIVDQSLQEITKDLLPKNSKLTDDKSVKVYPNPNSGRFIVELSKFDNPLNISVINTLGATVFSTHSIKSGTFEMNLSGIDKGIYIVRIVDGKTLLSKKIVVQ